MTRHVFIVKGDVSRIACDAWLLPTDAALYLAPYWRDIPQLRPVVHGHELTVRPPSDWAEPTRAFRVAEVTGPPAVYACDLGASRTEPVSWYIEAARQFIAVAAKDLTGQPPANGRAQLLLAMPVVGTGAGGARQHSGEVVEHLVAKLVEVAQEAGVDIALVTRRDRMFAAAQWARRQAIHRAGDLTAVWPALTPQLRANAERLAAHATGGHLVVFAGAGVSRGAGLPGWAEMLDLLAEEAGFAPAEVASLSQLNVLDRARVIRRRFTLDGRDVGTAVATVMQADRPSLLHSQLACLPISEAVTTNYDHLFEIAARATDRPFQVLPYEPARPGHRWLLKLHGSVHQPDDIVLTREDYLRYGDTRAALAGIVQALLITRHMVFVGFSLTDENFHRIVDEVRRAVGRQSADGSARFGTALLLRDEPLMRDLWQDEIDVVAMSDADARDGSEAARTLEIFVDCLLSLATDNADHLLDEDFDGLLSPAERELKARLLDLLQLGPEVTTMRAWRPVHQLLESLGLRDQDPGRLRHR